MRSLISLLGTIVNGGSDFQADDAIISVAFTVDLTLQPKRDVYSFTFLIFLAFWPN